jgi:type II secretory pathway pseudopilin PulG
MAAVSQALAAGEGMDRMTAASGGRPGRGRMVRGGRWLLALGLGALATCLSAAPASASTLQDCLAQQHVCVASDGRSLVSQSQEAQLEKQIGGDDIYLVVAASGSSGYTSSMDQIISDLNGHSQFTVGYLDTRQRHFGAYNKGMLPAHGAAGIATQVVEQHQGDVFAALTEFVSDVQHEAGSTGTGSTGSAPSHALRTILIVLAVIVLLAVLGFFLIARPIRKRRQQELKEAKSAAQDDLIALSTGLTDHQTDVSIQGNPEAAAEQAAALGAYERGTAALDSARRVKDMGAVSRAIAAGQYHLACADALAAGQARPDPRPLCFFDPRHGLSVRDVFWTPAAGGQGRVVPACASCAHLVEQGIEPEMRQVEVNGAPVSYVNAGFAPAYWGGFGLGPGLFTGFLLGEALGGFGGFGAPYYGGDYGGGNGGDFGGGDFGGGDFGGGDFGGGDFGGGDFGGGGDFS